MSSMEMTTSEFITLEETTKLELTSSNTTVEISKWITADVTTFSTNLRNSR